MVLEELFQDIVYVLIMQDLVFGKDEGIIRVGHKELLQQVSKNIIDEMLEHCRGFAQSEGHCQIHRVPMLVCKVIFHSSPSEYGQVISSMEVYIDKDLSREKCLEELTDEQ